MLMSLSLSIWVALSYFIFYRMWLNCGLLIDFHPLLIIDPSFAFLSVPSIVFRFSSLCFYAFLISCLADRLVFALKNEVLTVLPAYLSLSNTFLLMINNQ